MSERTQTHWTTCWEDPHHHACAVRKIAELQAIVDGLPKHKDGQLFDDYNVAPGTEAWCLFKYEADEPERISKCHTPTDPDEMMTCFDWIVEDAEDECVFKGPYSTREAAEAARKAAP